MKTILWFILIFPFTPTTFASEKTTGVDARKNSHSFDDLLVQGKFHFTDEAVTTVEEDKILESLLEPRVNFKDKVERSAKRF